MTGPADAGPADTGDEPIEAYLDDLLSLLHGPSRQIRRVLAEAEAHLREDAENRLREGASPADAQRAAIAAFGPAPQVARSCNAVAPGVRSLRRELRIPLVFVTAVGLLAIGVSGIIERVLVAGFGAAVVFGDPVHTSHSASACSSWMSIHPHAADCAAAYLAETVDDGLLQRFAAGALGVVLLAVAIWWTRRGRRPEPRTRLLTAVTVASVFGTAGVALSGYGIDQAASYGANGPGQWIAQGCVCLAVALAGLTAAARWWRPELA